MILSHFTKEPFKLDHNKIYHKSTYLKPTGLWLSDENKHEDNLSWSEWCKGTDYAVDNLINCTKFKVHNLIDISSDSAGVLLMKTTEELRFFTKSYISSISSEYCFTIDWSKVKSRYQGIVITPYLPDVWDSGFLSWYYSWDCASGCVWDLNSLTQLPIK